MENLNLHIGWRVRGQFTPRPLCTYGKSLPLDKNTGWIAQTFWTLLRGESFLLLPGIENRLLGHLSRGLRIVLTEVLRTMHGQACSYPNISSNLNRLNAFHYKFCLNANTPLTGTI